MSRWRRDFAVLFSLLLVQIGASAAHAQSGVSRRIHHQYVGPRPLGMGNAFVAVANDYNALFYNPAGLARRDDNEVNLFMDGGLSASFLQFGQEVSKAQATEGTESEKQQAVMEVLQKQYGRSYGIRTNLFGGIWVRPNWGMAILPMDLTIEESLHQSVGPSINATVYLDSTFAMGYAGDFKSFPGGKLSWGITGKAINRGSFSKSVNFLELATDSSIVQASDLREGFGVDADIGFLYTPRIPSTGLVSLLRLTRPTFGLVIRNIAESKFTSNMKLLNSNPAENALPPEQLYRVIDIGSRWEYPAAFIFGGRGVMDIRDIMHPNFSARKGLHLGFEFDWTVASWWRGAYRFGLNQGFWTAGASAMFTFFNLDLVSYGEDVGTFSTPVENRIYSLRASMNF